MDDKKWMVIVFQLLFVTALVAEIKGQACHFYPLGENRRFERVAENIKVDEEVFRVQVYPRDEFKLEAVDNSLSDINYFKFQGIDDKTVSIRVSKSLEDLVDSHDPQSVLKFKLTCRGSPGSEEAFLPVTVYIQDINDHAPEFLNTPYHLDVDELTPVGLTVFRGVKAVDKDKPNSPNSDISYSIVGGNGNNSFALSDPIDGILVVNKPLDFDHGNREFKLQIQASDHGSPQSLSSVTTLAIRVRDADDQNPIFTNELYRANVSESAVVTGATIRQRVTTEPRIHAFDQDTGINARLRYNIILGNERGFFELHDQTGELYLVKELDLESLSSPTLSLQIQATQTDNHLRYAISRVLINVLDINDNLPQFEFDTYNITVMENLPPGFTVVQVYAVDEDRGENSAFSYQMDDASGAFKIDPKGGWISVKDPTKLDRETKDVLIMKVRAVEKNPNINSNAKPSQTTVEIHLLDANDNNPQFKPTSVFTFRVIETDLPGTVIGKVIAVDPDLGDNGRVIFFKQNDSLSQTAPFEVSGNDGAIYITESFGNINVKPANYTFFVKATDMAENPSERRSSVAVVHVNVTDVNNNPPQFLNPPYEAHVGESLPPGAVVFQLAARDPDADTVLSYSIVAGNDETLFAINNKTGLVTTAAVLDYEIRNNYDLLVQASDGVNTAVSPLNVKIIDINDQRPQFSQGFYNFSIVEELKANVTVGTVLARDSDSGRNALVRYTLVGELANDAVYIDQRGNIVTRRRLDREKESKLELIVVAFDSGIPQLSGTASVAVNIEDINDNAPKFEAELYEALVPEEKDPPFKVFQLKATDIDDGQNAEIKYAIIGGNEDKVFGVDENSGIIFTASKLNYEQQSQYDLHIAARNTRLFQGPDAANLANPVVTLTIKVHDINDEQVLFERPSYQFRIPENAPRSITVGYLNATNPHRQNREQEIVFWIGGGNELGKFWINPKSGEIVLMDTVDRDYPANQTSFRMIVFARDMLSISSLNSSVPIIIDIEDVNDNAPKFNEEEYALELPESLPVGTELPSFFKAKDNDFGNNGKIERYFINGTQSPPFLVNGTSGALTLVSPLDYEKQEEHRFMVLATDRGNPQKTGSASVVIKIQNINEFSPEFIGLPYSFWVQENAPKDTRVGEVKAFDGDGNNVFYSITGNDADLFAIEETAGKVTVKKNLPSRSQYKFIVRATDDGFPQNNSLGVQVNVRVRETNDFAPAFTSPTYHGSVREKSQSDRVIVKVTATDLDLQENTIVYNITTGNEEGLFSINNSTGEIRLTPGQGHKLDYDKKNSYVLVVQASDSHSNPLHGITLVTVSVLDTNDHAPSFNKAVYSTSILENLPAGHCFLKVRAEGGDSGDEIKYFAEGSLPFLVNSKTGDICTKQILDREKKQRYDFNVLASDGKFETLASVSIDILDENDNPPKFEKSRYIASIPYTSQPGRSVIQVQATDPDSANNADVTYWIKNTHGIFEIDSKTGLVRLSSSVADQFSLNKTFEMEVFSQDHGAVSNIAKTMLVVRIANSENQPPKFSAFVYSVFVDENKANVALVTVKATDPDAGRNGKVTYRIARASQREAFRMDQKTGKITLVTPLDYETVKHLELVVEARDEAQETQSSSAIVQITVIDVNDNAPEFLATPAVLRVPQSTSQSEVIYSVQAIDKDSDIGGYNKVGFSLVPPSSIFSIHPKTGQIYATQPLIPVIETLHIVASDEGSPPLSSTMDVAIEVYKDSVDEPTPVFSAPQYYANMDGIIEAGSTVLEVRATVPNGSPVSYNITDVYGTPIQKFAVDTSGGRITATTKIDGSQPLHHFLVTASNKNDQRRRSAAGVVIKVKDTSSKCPKFPFTEYFAVVRENTPIDSFVLRNLAVDDPRHFAKLTYQLTEDSSDDNFVIDHRSRNVSLRIKNVLDRDTMPSILQGFYTLTVTASNDRCSGSTRVKIYVEDINDNSPVFEKNDYVVQLKENSPIGQVVEHLTATDKDQIDDKKLRYYIVKGNEAGQFSLSNSTGLLTVKTIPDREKTPAFVLQVVAIDTGNNTGFANVHITVLDENDWAPTFLNKTFVLNVTEGPASVGASIHLPIVDNDEGPNRQLEVYVADGNTDRQFRLGVDKQGQAIVTVARELDREKYHVPNSPIHIVIVAARDMGTPPKTGTATVAVVINDINDTPPKFEKDIYYSIISENSPVGTVIETVQATDADTPQKTNMTYSFARRSGNVPFAIDPISGKIIITRPLDISENQEHTITLEAHDGIWKNTAILKVYIREAEERDPRFNKVHYKFQVPENVAGAVVGQVELKARRTRINSQMKYSIVNKDARDQFNVTRDGIIFTKKGLDREKQSFYTFTVILEEKRPSTRVSVSEVTVEVLDTNDEIPKFMQNFQGTIKENSLPGSSVTIVPQISAVDNDSGNNSLIQFSLLGPGSNLFSIFENGIVVFTPPDASLVLDREAKEKYNFKVVATDRGNLSSAADLTVTVEDVNDNSPQFQHGPLHVLLPETARPGTRIAEVLAIDRDGPGPNSKVNYNIIGRRSGEIRIDRETGEIFVVATLQPSVSHPLNISASDGFGLASFTVVNVTVVDINDNRPKFDRDDYRFRIMEGNYSAQKYKVGVIHAVDEDTGRNGKVDYATIVTSENKKFPFSIDVHTGELFATGDVDREKHSMFRFKVMALDNGEKPLNTTVDVRIEIDDVNDEKPRFYTDPYLSHVPENLDPGHKVTQITAFDPDVGANGQVFYRLGEGHQNKFYIDSKDGTVWTLSTLDYEEQAFYNMSVIAYDHGNPSLSATAKLWVTVADTNDALPDFPKSVYTIELAENTRIGESVYTLDAGEGNFKYFLTNPNEVDTFEIERSTGQIRLIRPLDSLQKSHYRLMVKAVDDSDPPRSDSAEVNILVGTGHGVRLFPVRFYEVPVLENQLAPVVILDLNATDETAHRRVAYSIVGTDYNGLFVIEPESGRLSVTASLNRERKDKYTVKVRVENLSRKRYGRDTSSKAKKDMSSIPLAFDEALVIVNVADENDSPPVFENNGKPIIAAVPLEATFGFQVAKISAKDNDIGLNAAIRYDIIQKEEDASSKFHVDPVTGVIRSMVTFGLDGSNVYGFDVKATDREGSENGNSAVTNVFVYVLPETKLVLFVAGREPLIIEQHLKEILSLLSNITRYKVLAAKLEPHHEGDTEDQQSTDLFMYAVDEHTNEIVDTEILLSMFRENSQMIVEQLEAFRILRIQGVSVQEKISQMGATEMAIIALSSVIFLGAVLGITLLCTTCKKRRMRRHQKTWEQQRLYNIKNPLMGKSVGNPYGSRKGNGSISHISASYANGSVPPGDYSDSLNDDQSMKKNNKKLRQMMPPDGASSINPSRSPHFDRPPYDKNDANWYDMRDGADSIGTGFSKSSAFTSWSSRHSRRKPVTEL